MYRPTLALPGVFAIALLVAGIAVFASTRESWAGTGSQGTVTGGAEAQNVSSEKHPAYSTIIDNSDGERFSAPGWTTESAESGKHGQNYSVEKPGEKNKPARFEVKIPATDRYSVYAWWPASESNGSAIRFGVSSTGGTKWSEVDQGRDGGSWVKIGTYEMKRGARAIRVSPGSEESGKAVADAVAVVRGEQASPPDESYDNTPQSSTNQSVFYSMSTGSPKPWQVVRVARKHLGTPYGHTRCQKDVREDCSCHTRLVFKRFGRNLPDSPTRQWTYGHKIAKANLRRGDLVFFKENGPSHPITHVAIYAGNGYVIHASNYFHKVAESKMKYIHGYYGAKRLKLY